MRVFREDDGQYAAEWLTADGFEAGMSHYSATPVGALANLCATLIKVAEDKSRESFPAAVPAPAADLVALVREWQEAFVRSRMAFASLNDAEAERRARVALLAYPLPAAQAHQHDYRSYDICRICGQTPAAIEGCHHCDEPDNLDAGRCWWCLKPTARTPEAARPERPTKG